MRLSFLLAFLSLLISPLNSSAEDMIAFSSITYSNIKGSWGYNTISINQDWTAEYIRTDSHYDRDNLPGRATGIIPTQIANAIIDCVRNFKFDPNQTPNPHLRKHQSFFGIKTTSGGVIRQPYPDPQHQELLPAYSEIEKLFLQAIEYLRTQEDTSFILCEASAAVDQGRHVLFTIKITNTGNTAITIENILYQRELASTYSEKSGAGPIYNQRNTTIIKANFDVQQNAIRLAPHDPLLLEIRSMEPASPGDFAFTIGPPHIEEVTDSGASLQTFSVGSVVVDLQI